ncbi:MAG: hypothetical protein U0936_20670 [Planctomycetaceae bacterium]
MAAIAQTVVQNDAEMLLVFVVASISQGKGRPWNYSQSLIDGGNCRPTSQTKPRIWTDETILRFTNGNDAAKIRQSTGDDAWARKGIFKPRWLWPDRYWRRRYDRFTPKIA